jgi:hypothetical protein
MLKTILLIKDAVCIKSVGMKGRLNPPWRAWGCAAGLVSFPFAGACLGGDEEKMWLGGADPIHCGEARYDNGNQNGAPEAGPIIIRVKS